MALINPRINTPSAPKSATLITQGNVLTSQGKKVISWVSDELIEPDRYAYELELAGISEGSTYLGLSKGAKITHTAHLKRFSKASSQPAPMRLGNKYLYAINFLNDFFVIALERTLQDVARRTV